MTAGSKGSAMNQITRRRLITGGVAATAGVAGLAAAARIAGGMAGAADCKGIYDGRDADVCGAEVLTHIRWRGSFAEMISKTPL